MTGGKPQAWLEAAAFERDRRLERYPRLVRDRKIAAEDATVDYQCWCAIAEWIDTDRWPGWTQNAGTDGQTILTWAMADGAATKALATITAKLERAEVAEAPDDDELVELARRKANLFCIHRAVATMRRHVELVNREIRAPREKEIAA